MSDIKRYNVSLNKSVVEEAKQNLEVGQKLSPVLSELLRQWNKSKEKKE